MENKEKELSGEESLKIITDMISKTKLNIQQSSFHLLFWGWLTLFCSLSDYLLDILTDYERPYLIWLLSIPGVFVSMIYGFRQGKRQTVSTYADKINMWTWMAFMISAVILFILLSRQMENIAPFILLLAGYATFMSGIIIKFKPLILGGVSFWIFALLAYFTSPTVAPLAVPFAVLTGYLIPGYLIRKEVN